MKTPEDTINRFINEENVQFNQERDDWMIEAMEEYAKEYHQQQLSKASVIGSLPHIHKAGKVDIDECGICGHDIRHEIHVRL